MAYATQVAALLLPSVQKRTSDRYEQVAQKTNTPDHSSFSKQLQQADSLGPKTTVPDVHPCEKPASVAQNSRDKGYSPIVQQTVATKQKDKNKKPPDLETPSCTAPLFPAQKTLQATIASYPLVANKKISLPLTTSLSPTSQQRQSLLLLQVAAHKQGKSPTVVPKTPPEVWKQSSLLMTKMEMGKNPVKSIPPKKEPWTHSLRFVTAGLTKYSPALVNSHSRFSYSALTQESTQTQGITVASSNEHNNDRSAHHAANVLFAAQQEADEPFWVSSTPVNEGGEITHPFLPQLLHSTTNTPISVTHPSWPHAFTQNVAFLLRRGIPEAMISVDPRHLGPIKIHLTWENHVVHTNFFCHNDTIKQMIEGSLPILQHMLLQTGVHLGQTNVSDQSQLMPEQQAFFSVQHDVNEDIPTTISSPTSGIDVFV